MESAFGPDDSPLAVLDTNVVLDWLVFRDDSATPWVEAIEGGRMRWLSCPRMRHELLRTLNYSALARWQPDSEHVLTSFDRWSIACPTPGPSVVNPACTDTDDQVFIDLALAEGAQWLLTHDRALLKLARRLLARGVHVVTPARWSAVEAKRAAEAAPD